MEEDQKFIEDVVKAIVDSPEKVSTARTIDERGVLIELTVAPDDMGKIIGKEGRTAKAIRTLLRVFGAKNDARLNLKIVEPEGSERPERKEYNDEDRSDDYTPREEKKNVLDDVPEDVLA
ncbi:MAG: KH domain-containing protein [Candidatus Berkelbacteria bacterium]